MFPLTPALSLGRGRIIASPFRIPQPLGRRGACIHVLQAVENWTSMPPGAPYGKLLLHYANGVTRSFYPQFRIHGLDWYGGPRTPEEGVADPSTRSGWFFKKKDGSYRRFFHTIFANPLPDMDISSVDFISPLESANLCVSGFTIPVREVFSGGIGHGPASARRTICHSMNQVLEARSLGASSSLTGHCVRADLRRLKCVSGNSVP